MMSLSEVIDEVRRRKLETGEIFYSSLEHWLLNKNNIPKIKEYSEREKVCCKCSHISASLKWCCQDRINPVSIEEMTIPPADCPYILGLLLSLGE